LVKPPAGTRTIEAAMIGAGNMLASFLLARPGVEKSELNIRVMG
jgi:hypothetical protein